MSIKWPELNFPPLNLWNIWRMEPKNKINTTKYRGFTNKECEFYPCHDTSEMKHPDQFNCLFCYCPLVWLECPGPYSVIKDANGVYRKDCSMCTLPHDGYDTSWKLMNLTHWQKEPKQWKPEIKEEYFNVSGVPYKVTINDLKRGNK